MSAEVFVAKRYAKAFLNIFVINAHDLVNIKRTIQFLEAHREVFSLLKVPLLDPEIKINALKYYLIERFSLPSSFVALIHLLVNQKRAYLINKVLIQIEMLYEEQQGIETFIITSSDMLKDTELKIVQDFLASGTHHTITSTPKVDTALIGGIRMQSADHLWEYSIRKQLAAIEAQLSE